MGNKSNKTFLKKEFLKSFLFAFFIFFIFRLYRYGEIKSLDFNIKHLLAVIISSLILGITITLTKFYFYKKDNHNGKSQP